MNKSTPVRNPSRATPIIVSWLMVAVALGCSWLLASEPVEPEATLALVEMPQLHGSAAHRGAVTAAPGSALGTADAAATSDALQVAALQAP